MNKKCSKCDKVMKRGYDGDDSCSDFENFTYWGHDEADDGVLCAKCYNILEKKKDEIEYTKSKNRWDEDRIKDEKEIEEEVLKIKGEIKRITESNWSFPYKKERLSHYGIEYKNEKEEEEYNKNTKEDVRSFCKCGIYRLNYLDMLCSVCKSRNNICSVLVCHCRGYEVIQNCPPYYCKTYQGYKEEIRTLMKKRKRNKKIDEVEKITKQLKMNKL
jgi:thymidylate synthase